MIGKIWTTAVGVAVLAVASVLGAPAASAAGSPTITVEYRGLQANNWGVAQPTIVIRGTGFTVAGPGVVERLDTVTFLTSDGSRFGFTSESTLESKMCTHTVPSYCIIQYEAGELRPQRMFLGDGTPGNGRTAVCGDLIEVLVKEIKPSGAEIMRSNAVRLRVPCDTYTPRPPRPIG